MIVEMQKTLSELHAGTDAAAATAIALRLRQSFNELMDIDKHYQRKEHALFSCLERHGITGPSKVMWAKDDAVRNLVKRFGQCIQRESATVDEWKAQLLDAVNAALSAVQEMIYKEENILLPMSLQALSEDEWAEIWSVSPKYGWCIVEPQQGYKPPLSVTRESINIPSSGGLMLPTGNVTLEQLVAIFSTLPRPLVDSFTNSAPHRAFGDRPATC